MRNSPTVTAAALGLVVALLIAKAAVVVGLLSAGPITAVLGAPFGVAAYIAGQQFLAEPSV